MWPFKKKPEFKYSESELASLQSFMKGFELGLQVSSEVDEKVKHQIRQEAISETLARMNGTHKTTH